MLPSGVVLIIPHTMPTLKTCQVAPELYFRHVDPKSIVKSHRENVLCLHGMENGGLPLIRSIAEEAVYDTAERRGDTKLVEISDYQVLLDGFERQAEMYEIDFVMLRLGLSR